MEYTRLMELIEAYEQLTEDHHATPPQIREKLKTQHHATDDEVDFLLREVFK